MRPFLSRILLLIFTLAALELSAQGLPAAAPRPAPPGSASLGDLLLSPNRVVFEGRKRTEEVLLSNIGLTRATYRISLVRMEMDENGGFQEQPAETGPGSTSALFRFSPREVVLEPGETQTVRIQVRKPADLAVGEYRLHMVFRGVPAADDAAATPVEATKEQVAVSLRPIYGMAIPIILRHGTTPAKAALAEPKLLDGGRTLRFRLERSGNQSIYGDLKATLLPPSGKPAALAQANGLAVYASLPSRTVTMTLPPDQPLPGGGRIRITFTAPSENGGALLAETTLTLP